uniref:Serine/threonine-protein kinase mph1 n=1 Tax=Cajanus cajan TaxID=3821 RepID=A0A151R2A7_CAJCA|nr:Serine/threonine-protein kinase mph1 [Cajanus cajan]
MDGKPNPDSSSPDFLRHVQAALKRHRPLGTMHSNSIRPRRTLLPQRTNSQQQPPPPSSHNLDPHKKVHFSTPTTTASQEMEWVEGNQVEASSSIGFHQQGNVQKVGFDASLRSDSGVPKRSVASQDNLQQFRSFLSQPATQSSCATTTSVHSTSAPMLNSTTRYSHSHQDGGSSVAAESLGEVNVNPRPMNDGVVKSVSVSNRMSVDCAEAEVQASGSCIGGAVLASQESDLSKEQQGDVKLEASKVEKREKAASSKGASAARKRTYDPDLFFKVNGKLYQRLGKIDGLATELEILSSHMSSLRFAEMEWVEGNQVEASSSIGFHQQGNVQKVGFDASLRSDSGVPKRSVASQDNLQQFRSFLSQPATQSSCATTTSVHSTSAPMLNSTTRYSHSHQDGKEAVDVATIQPQAPPPTTTTATSSSDVKLEASKVEKREKAASSKGASAARKRTYDPDLFFKVNGKLYQRLGKIGSGGSSEVHKVISSDCRIYALKKIKLKGRDYATAYGFCQEIEYLNRLKGKDNIIQLIDYEVTDKALLEEVMKGSFSNKDGRVKDDGCIYMVLEYGEIDLAHMLSQKWKELDRSNQTIDENWLRFYWQQILLAVNTIHEERIVHSDLKPANFLLVKGSLKLIDFGIAKAIMNDTTNIQRDSQVGTLSYMSPEAFMCNEADANGNIIKCGRSSDIWSLGCILYQMVYGRTPFSDYKTFWAKFKVITDPNHEITYEPVSNSWLLDLMKRCLAWDRNQRWRIPQLLQHPFLVPPVPCHSSLAQDHSCKLLQFISETCTYDPEASQLCSRLQLLLSDPPEKTTHSLNSLDQQLKLLSQMSELCIQLHERLSNTENK